MEFIMRSQLIFSLVVKVLLSGANHTVGFLGPRNCSLRFMFLSHVKTLINCSKMVELNPMCGRDITVLHSNTPPYIFTDENGNVTGILQKFLEETLISHCCMGCNNLIFLKPMGVIEKFIEFGERRVTADIVIPVENGLYAETFFNEPYISLIPLTTIVFIAAIEEHSSTVLIETLLKSTVGTWPLAVVALTMAICAGTIVWLMDTWFNRNQFPRSFPKGPFEGFWWAYVSMTTVGYGDRTPHSAAARIFAVFWILTGITIFNMFTATITSRLTTQMNEEHTFSVYKKNIGILSNSTASTVGVIKENANHINYDNIESLLEAYEKGRIYGIAMEGITAFHHLDYIKQHNSKMKIQLSTELRHNAMGLISNSSDIVQLMGTFFEANQDSRDILTGRSLLAEYYNFTGSKEDEQRHSDPFTINHDLFYITIASMLSISLICVLVSTLIRSERLTCFKHLQTKNER